ncbi:MAG: alpha/beta hydrolase [Gammaproteobacteria bacterium]|jgi:esterase
MAIHSTMLASLKYLSLLTFVAVIMFGHARMAVADQWQPQVKTVRVNNYDMAYVERGSGVPLILVHGSLSDYRTWLPLMAELSETNRTIAISLRHYYPEQWDGKGDDFSLNQHADDVAAFIKTLNLVAVDLLGHSRGGVVSMLVASQYPELVNNLVLADPAPLWTMLSDNTKARKLLETRKSIVKKTVKFYQQGNPEGGLETFVNYIAGPKAWEKTSESRRNTLRDNSWTQVGQLQDFETQFDCRSAGKISSRVLMITGERSAPIYGYMHSALQSCLKHSNNALIADAGHMMFHANPTAFTFEVQEFIAP